jgi:hypothetical protein
MMKKSPKRPAAALKKKDPKAYHKAMVKYYDAQQRHHEDQAKRANTLYDKHWQITHNLIKKQRKN